MLVTIVLCFDNLVMDEVSPKWGYTSQNKFNICRAWKSRVDPTGLENIVCYICVKLHMHGVLRAVKPDA